MNNQGLNAQLLRDIENWFDNLANTEGVLVSERRSHTLRVAAAFHISPKMADMYIDHLISKWNVEQASTTVAALRAEDKRMANRHIRKQKSDVVFVRSNDPDTGHLRIINTEGRTMSISGPTIDHHDVASDRHQSLFHRVDVGFWNYDASGVHGHPATTAEEILEVLAHHLGYEVTKRS